MKLNRRADIDSLRALSVISVIGFHLDNNFFPLGFLGVDIFFIISGFLISRIVIKKCNNNSFSFKDFYIRRAKRILPALFFLLLSVLILGSFILLLSDYKNLIKSLISVVFFGSNIYFWVTGGYFGAEESLKPLLHTWSLGVEEQFYLFFPFIFFYLLKYLKKNYVKILFVILIIFLSYSLNILFLKKGHLEPNFFLLPMRIWQFSLGTLAALMMDFDIKNIKFKNYIIYLSIFLIFFNFVYLIPDLPSSTLLSFGCFFILLLQIDSENIFYKIINLKFLTTTGLISYSLYLWHWPIITFLKYTNIFNFNFFFIATCIFFIYLISFLSWKYIEKPFLDFNVKLKKIKILTLVFVFISCSSFLILKIENFPSRYKDFPNNLAKAVGSTYHCSLLDYIKFGDTFACLINRSSKKSPSIILYGNSHAHMYGWPLKELLKENDLKGLSIPLNACLPTIDKNRSVICLYKARKYFDAILKNNEIKKIIIGLTWYTKNFVDENNNSFYGFDERNKSLLYLIDQLKKNGKIVYLLGPIQIPNYDLASIVSRELAFNKKTSHKLFGSKKKFNEEYSNSIILFNDKLNKNFLLPHQVLCDEELCYYADEFGSNFSDRHHLSKYGSLKMKDIMRLIFQK